MRLAPELAEAYSVTVAAAVAVIAELNRQIDLLAEAVEAHFGRHPDAEIILSQPGLGMVLGARVLGEFGDAPARYADAKARKNYSGMSPITRASGTKRVVLARYARNRRLADALYQQAFAALSTSPGARAYYDRQRARGASHHPSPTRPGQPSGRHPPRMPHTPHPLRRSHRLAAPTSHWNPRRLTR